MSSRGRSAPAQQENRTFSQLISLSHSELAHHTDHTDLRDMIEARFRDIAIGGAVECSRNAVGHIRANLRYFRCTTAPLQPERATSIS